MKYVVIGAKDQVTGAWMPVNCVQDMLDEDIVESHRRAVLAGKIPAEIARSNVIYKFGTFNDKTGELTTLEKPELLCVLADFIVKQTATQGELANGQKN